MKRWQLVILIFELVLFAAILVLPQVALPDFTFHGGTAPVAAHSRVCHATPGTAIAAAHQTLIPEPVVLETGEVAGSLPPASLHSRLSQLCVLIC
jgi:hypothetical protein